MSGEVLKKFGRYFLLDHLAQGGMAEIFRAMPASAEGLGRVIVIKRIQGGFGANSEFLQMFKSEIKVTMGFNHPNIVQLYDFGEEQNKPYISMEWVDGRNLRQFMSRFAELKQTFPVELAAHIIEQASSGLHYAHSFRDKVSGEALNIVHRDISPQNILISFEGNVKVIDFGIAKATTNLESTRAGVIKGKPSYLSPEQISGEVLDGRSDIFALGTVLWELLTGKKLFSGESDLAVLKLIESCQTHVKPPSTLNPKVPKELDYIVLKSLAKQREKRYQTAEELQRALHKFLYAFMPEFNPTDLSYYAKDLFKKEIVEDRKRIQMLNEKAEQLLQNQSDHLPEESSQPSEDEDIEPTQSKTKSKSSEHRSLILTLEEDTQNSKIEIEANPALGLEKSKISVGASSSKSTLDQSHLSLPTNTRSSGKVKNGYPVSSLSRSTLNRDTHETFEKKPRDKGKFIATLSMLILILSLFGPGMGIEIPLLSGLVGNLVGSTNAQLIIDGKQKNATVSVNGQVMAQSLPATLSGIPVGTPFQLLVVGASGSGTYQQEIILKKGEQKTLSIVLNPESPIAGTSPVSSPKVFTDPGSISPVGAPSSTATSAIKNAAPSPNSWTESIVPGKSILLSLVVQPTSSEATLMLNGKLLDPTQPSTVVPFDSTLELSIDLAGFKPFRRQFVLSASQSGNQKQYPMEIQLEPSQFGYLTIHTTPSADALLTLGNGSYWKKKTPIENEKLLIGNYTVKLTNDVLGMEKTINLSIQESKALSLDERLEIKN